MHALVARSRQKTWFGLGLLVVAFLSVVAAWNLGTLLLFGTSLVAVFGMSLGLRTIVLNSWAFDPRASQYALAAMNAESHFEGYIQRPITFSRDVLIFTLSELIDDTNLRTARAIADSASVPPSASNRARYLAEVEELQLDAIRQARRISAEFGIPRPPLEILPALLYSQRVEHEVVSPRDHFRSFDVVGWLEERWNELTVTSTIEAIDSEGVR